MGDAKRREQAGQERLSETLRVQVDPATIEPLGHMVLLERLPEDVTAAGLVLPDSVKVRNRARVLSTGPGRLCENGQRVPLGVKAGDVIVLAPGVGMVAVGSLLGGNAVVLADEGIALAIDRGTHDGVLRIGALQ